MEFFEEVKVAHAVSLRGRINRSLVAPARGSIQELRYVANAT